MPVDLEVLQPFIRAIIEVQRNRQNQDQFDRKQKLDEDQFKEQQKRNKELLDLRKKEMELEEADRKFRDKQAMFNLEQTLRQGYATGTRSLDRAPNVVPGTPEELINASALRDLTIETPFGPMNLSGVRDRQDIKFDERQEFKNMTPFVAERAGEVAGATADAQLPNLLIRGQQQLDLLNARNQQAKNLQDERLKAQSELEDKRNKNQLARDRINNAVKQSIAAAKLTANETVSPEQAELSMHRIIQAEDTIESLTKQLPIKQRRPIIMAAESAGIKVLRDQDVKDLTNLKALKRVYEKYVELSKEADKKIPNPGRLWELEKEADVMLGSVSIAIGGESGGRLSDQDIKRARGAKPTWHSDLFDSKANARKLKDLEAGISAVVDQVTFGMKPEQRQIIIEKYNLLPSAGGSDKIQVTRDPATGKLQ